MSVSHRQPRALALALAAAFPLFASSLPARAQSAAAPSPVAPSPAAPAKDATLDAVVVTANPLGAGRDAMIQPASVLEGPALDARRAPSLGETLAGEPGVSSTGFGPNASRPVIRGLDGDRIRLLRNGATSLDASSVSFDHATALEPLVAERIEVVRGPASLLYGGSALGGVVNVIDNRIPGAPIEGVGGRAELRFGGAERERAGVAVVEGGDGRVAWHADAWWRDTEDLRVPGWVRSARQRALDAQRDPDAEQPRGRVPNTASRGSGATAGVSRTWADGHAGIAIGSLRSDYGTPAEEDVGIRMRQDSIDLSAETRALPGFVHTLRFRANHSDYRHDEIERADGEVHTAFRTRGHEIRVEALHAPIGPFKGVFGLQHGRSDFSAVGHEAYLPSTVTDTTGLFIHEEIERARWKFGVGARIEFGRVRSAGDGAGGEDHEEHDHHDHDHDHHGHGDDMLRFGEAQSRRFTAKSLSTGGSFALTPTLSLAGNLSYTERIPTHYELFSNGPHVATGTWEIGDAAARKERSNAIDLSLRHRVGPNQLSLGVWQTRFSNYLQLDGTGRFRGEDGSFEDPSSPGLTTTGEVAELPEYVYRQVPATFRGVELMLRHRLFERAGILDLELKADRVSAHDRATGEPLPRIAPVRWGAALVYSEGPLRLRADLMRVSAQRRVAGEELPTDGYTLLDLYANWRIHDGRVAWDLFARAKNLLNEQARNHTSLLKDVAPLGGRSLLVGLRATF